MVFSIDNLTKPTKKEYEAARWLEIIDSDLLDSQELWIIENFTRGDNDD